MMPNKINIIKLIMKITIRIVGILELMTSDKSIARPDASIPISPIPTNNAQPTKNRNVIQILNQIVFCHFLEKYVLNHESIGFAEVVSMLDTQQHKWCKP